MFNRDRLKGGPQVWWILLFTTSAWPCLQHSRNLEPAFKPIPVHTSNHDLPGTDDYTEFMKKSCLLSSWCFVHWQRTINLNVKILLAHEEQAFTHKSNSWTRLMTKWDRHIVQISAQGGEKPKNIVSPGVDAKKWWQATCNLCPATTNPKTATSGKTSAIVSTAWPIV